MNFFGFIDETGILQNAQNQPYFALGLLRLKDTSDLLQQIMSIKARHRGIFMAQSRINDFDIGELKFNKLKSEKYLEMYKDIIRACFSYDHFYFSAKIVDKTSIHDKENLNTWDLQLKLSKFHIKQHCKNENQIAIIADYLNRPKGKPSFESKINKVKNVFNACMLESDTSIFIQIVDILIGAIVYRYKNTDKTNTKFKATKMQLVEFIEQQLQAKSKSDKNRDQYKGVLKGKFSIFADNFYFSVYDKN